MKTYSLKEIEKIEKELEAKWLTYIQIHNDIPPKPLNISYLDWILNL